MNTRIILTASAGIMILTGIAVTFAPEIVLNTLQIDQTKMSLLMSQVMGAMYFAFGMLNWFCKGSLIGGIYNRPVAISNFSHFMITALAIGKFLLRESSLPISVWVVGIVYVILAVLFGMILFTHPIKDGDKQTVQS